MRLCLDPGHGGYDPGAVGPAGLKEKDVVLAVALETASLLKNSPVEVTFTRTTDRVPWSAEKRRELAMRAEIANGSGADLFVSIHCNGAADPGANGTETYYYEGSSRGAKAAEGIQHRLVAALKLRDRGVKTADFYVLRKTAMPAVLAELAFITNPQEEKLLAQPDFRTRAARAIAQGVADYFGFAFPGEEQPPAEPRLVIDGRLVTGVPFHIVEGRTFVELRAFVKEIGGKVDWDEGTRTIIVSTTP
ncbi:MAG TPA: N-acetylmuramoyl-L-alanine amidase [Desulfotomaculum sp.]|nr:N-acetylmuramoyl-L-alanine amidase [Desulfotomaculum sp.]